MSQNNNWEQLLRGSEVKRRRISNLWQVHVPISTSPFFFLYLTQVCKRLSAKGTDTRLLKRWEKERLKFQSSILVLVIGGHWNRRACQTTFRSLIRLFKYRYFCASILPLFLLIPLQFLNFCIIFTSYRIPIGVSHPHPLPSSANDQSSKWFLYFRVN